MQGTENVLVKINNKIKKSLTSTVERLDHYVMLYIHIYTYNVIAPINGFVSL